MIHALKADLIPIILESINILEEQGELFNSVIDARDIETSIEIPKNRANGDLSSNIALRKSKESNLDALKLANLIANSFNSNLVKQSKHESLWHNVEVARPGFLNFRINPFAKLSRLCTVLTEQDYGWEKSKNIEKIILEYVSANPTGPLHVGHARQAVLGDAISNILSKAGHDTYREFYYNDAGNQIENLALSVWARLNGYDQNSEEFPKDGYRGSYIIEIANKFRILKKATKLTKFEKSKKLLNEIKNFSIGCLRDEQNSDLELLGISFDNFALESDFYQNGLVDDVITNLKKNGMTFFVDNALWLRSTDFGDDKDRVMIKSDGSYTYFVPDIAYHLDKWRRGFGKAINIQGTDHHGTVQRVKAGLQGLNKKIDKNFPMTILHKMVTVKKNGKDVKFSKRSGDYVTLKDLIYFSSGFDEVNGEVEYCENKHETPTILSRGKDAVRFFLLSKKPETEFNFDVSLAQKNSEENPVFYVQYAHARASSVIRQSCVSELELLEFFSNLNDAAYLGSESVNLNSLENELAHRVLGFSEVTRTVLKNVEPHQLVFYLQDLASDFHKFYNDSKILVEDTWTRNKRLLLVYSVAKLLKNNLELIGINAPEKM